MIRPFVKGNGLTDSKTYDNRERLLSSSQFQAGSTVGYSVSANYYPNGNVQTSNDSVNGNWTYGYDPENRLGSAVSSAGLNLAWTYDSFGNREAQTASGTGSAPQPSFTFSGNNNQADPSGGFLYDAAGNIITDNLGQNYAYDAEGRISSVSGAGANAVYQYDSDGQLVL
jgi:YD repeat-containing protein